MSRAQRRREGDLGRHGRRDAPLAPQRFFQQVQVQQYKVQAYELGALSPTLVNTSQPTWKLVQDVGPLASREDAEKIFLQMCSVVKPLVRRIVKLFSKGTFGDWVVERQCGG